MTRKDRVLLHYHISHRLHSSLCAASYSLTNGTCRTAEGKKKEEMWNSVYVTIQIYKNKLHFKAGNSHTHQSHCYLHTHQHHEGEGVSTGLSKRRTNLHSAPFTWLWRANSWNFNSTLFTLKSLLRHTTRNNLFFQEILIAKKPSLCKMEMTQRAPPLCQEKVP